MNRFRTSCFAALAALLLTTTTLADPVDDLLREEMSNHHIPGAALMVILDGKAVKSAAYGLANLELNVPVQLQTVFEIGSITKQFTSACILLLQQDGKLSVDDKIARHLPNTPAAWTNVTIRHLLSHTSGIKSYTGLDGFALTKRLTQAQFIQAIGVHALEFQPGESWKYSNSGYNLLGYIVENVSDRSYWEFLRERILLPLEMNTTTDRNPATIITNRADGYEHTNVEPVNRDYDVTDVFAAGAIVSTVGDLAKWSAAIESDKLLTARTKEQMWTPQKLNDGNPTRYGYGWRIENLEGRRNVGHSGSTSGFSASFQRFPDDGLTVVLLTNTGEQIATTLARKVASLHLANDNLK
jgi:CubicO group peptidase (beta-lactamase class C family)